MNKLKAILKRFNHSTVLIVLFIILFLVAVSAIGLFLYIGFFFFFGYLSEILIKLLVVLEKKESPFDTIINFLILIDFLFFLIVHFITFTESKIQLNILRLLRERKSNKEEIEIIEIDDKILISVLIYLNIFSIGIILATGLFTEGTPNSQEFKIVTFFETLLLLNSFLIFFRLSFFNNLKFFGKVIVTMLLIITIFVVFGKL